MSRGPRDDEVVIVTPSILRETMPHCLVLVGGPRIMEQRVPHLDPSVVGLQLVTLPQVGDAIRLVEDVIPQRALIDGSVLDASPTLARDLRAAASVPAVSIFGILPSTTDSRPDAPEAFDLDGVLIGPVTTATCEGGGPGASGVENR
jgi:hypothetical protein